MRQAFTALRRLVLIPLAFGLHERGAAQDILCDEVHPALVEAIPAPFDAWTTIICTDDGQQLVPEMGDDGTLWIIHETLEPFGIPALPPILSAERKERLIKSLGDEARFVRIVGGQLDGPVLDNMRKMFALAFPEVEAAYDSVYQLDAVSIYAGFTYNLFFYVTDGAPTHLISCVLRCERSVSIEIINVEEAGKRLDAQQTEYIP